MSRGRPAVAVLAGLAGIAAAGCGTAADRTQARAATERFYAAVQHHDGRTACAQLSPPTRAQLVKDQSEPDCAKAVLKLSLHGSRAGTVQVYATSARVALARGDTVFLGYGQQGWRIDAVGCRPQGNGLFDCEEQA